MEVDATKSASKVLIGDLLVKSEVVTLQQLADAMPIALKTGLPLGRILVGSGSITKFQLQQALSAQSLIRDKLLGMDLATKAIKLVCTDNVTLDSALKQLEWNSDFYERTNKLGQLLLDAGYVTTEQLNKALETFITAGLPLGRILVLQGSLSDLKAYSALTAQVLIREGAITRQQALEALRSCTEKNISFEQSLDYHGFLNITSNHTLRLGELLMLSEFVSEIELIEAVEQSLVNNDYIGETLVKSGHIPRAILEHSLRLQEMVSAQQLTPMQAVKALQKVKKGTPFDTAVREATGQIMPDTQLGLPELLILSGLAAKRSVESAQELAVTTGSPLETIMVRRNDIDEAAFKVAERCLSMMNRGRLSTEQAIFALQCWRGCKRSFDEILEQLGWSVD